MTCLILLWAYGIIDISFRIDWRLGLGVTVLGVLCSLFHILF